MVEFKGIKNECEHSYYRETIKSVQKQVSQKIDHLNQCDEFSDIHPEEIYGLIKTLNMRIVIKEQELEKMKKK